MHAIFTECKEKTDTLINLEATRTRTDYHIRSEAALLISVAHTFNQDRDIEISASRAGLNPKASGLDFIGSIRRSLLVAALRTLEGQ